MHMADALLSPMVGMAMNAVGIGAVAISSAKVGRDDVSEKIIPLMGISGALVFAAQMINFTIPGTGSSGHIGGGILLAGLLGGPPAFLSIAAVLIIQCLFFADGGLLALGCNMFNLGVIPCLIVYPFIYKPLLKNGVTKRCLAWVTIIAAIASLEVGALCVVLQTWASGITSLPFGAFAAMMLPIHLAIALVEGVVTAGILAFVYQERPEILESVLMSKNISNGTSFKKVALILAVLTFVAAGILPPIASSHPDGLEWAIEKVAGSDLPEPDGIIHESAAAIRDSTAVLPDYGFPGADEKSAPLDASVSGVVGAGITFALASIAGCAITKVRKIRKRGGLPKGAS
ncbi:MAG: energy-coupling factor ABC transporter permease [Peptococcaceae bacterium]|jgi:cobalt/nickel transport system permease protein|nr:energy-coupling factor ABC transporter permease [Peptococcaceae bacterium]